MAATQSRLTVDSETCSTAAVSSMERPAKWRNSTMRLCCASSCSRAVSAASRSSRSTSGAGAMARASSVELDDLGAGSALLRVSGARVVHQHGADDARRDREEVGAVGPGLAGSLLRQAQVRLVHQRRGLKGVPLALTAHVSRRNLVQFRVDDFHQARERLRVSVGPVLQEAGDFRPVGMLHLRRRHTSILSAGEGEGTRHKASSKARAPAPSKPPAPGRTVTEFVGPHEVSGWAGCPLMQPGSFVRRRTRTRTSARRPPEAC